MGKNADLAVVQKTIIDTLHKESKPQKVITERVAVYRVLYQSILNAKLTGRKKLVLELCELPRLYLLWITSSPEVRRFLARQPGHIQSDYQQLRQAIIKEFSDPESEHGLIAALDTKQGWYETPRVYYHRLRQAYFGARNEPGMEEDTSFKSLFLQNLHPMVSHHLGILACPHSMPIQQLRDLTHKAFDKHKASTKGVCKNPLILDCTTQNSKQAPEGTQHCHNAWPFYKKTLANRGHNRRHSNRPRFQTTNWEEPWKRVSSACKHHGMSNSSQPHPPPHLSHRG
ncbi:Dihydroorotase [Labeo rohita]|uniref:Dihydroorotase n=1 Tax=Labeo rohita TaxID=84645 RepID=A0ABQ8MV74_LABRO|nr:Dihydroorotase [Labeo rohita]